MTYSNRKENKELLKNFKVKQGNTIRLLEKVRQRGYKCLIRANEYTSNGDYVRTLEKTIQI